MKCRESQGLNFQEALEAQAQRESALDMCIQGAV